MSPNQLPPQNTIALATVGMERERVRGGEREILRDIKGAREETIFSHLFLQLPDVASNCVV